MAPVPRSAYEMYQKLYKNKPQKNLKSQHLRHELLLADLNGSLKESTSQKAEPKRLVLNPKSEENKVKKKLKKKALKRLSAGTSKPSNGILKIPEKQPKESHNHVKKSITSPTQISLQEEGPSKKSTEGSSKKIREGNAKKSRDPSKEIRKESGKKSKQNSGKISKDMSVKASREILPSLLVNGPAKKVCKRMVDTEEDVSSSEVESPPKRKEKKKKRKVVENEIGKPPKFLMDEDVPVEDSCKSGKDVLQWLLTPILVEPFLEKYWEKRPLYISRSFHRDFLDGILSSEDIDRALRENSLQYTRNIDVTSYKDGVRETLNPVGRAHAYTVWDYYRNGCSVRILNPQTYFPKLRKICTILQECFKSFVGANVYLTPPNSQGFAPHYDDIEAFVLQLEGKKHWRVYPPRKGEKLPRTSSKNFTEEQMPTPLLEVELQPGDILYMPRGFVHQANTVPNTHSLHVTISTYQHSSWADVLEKVIPAALQTAVATDPEFREGIPWNFFDNSGVMYSTDETQERKLIFDKIRHLCSKLFEHAPIDAAADQMFKEFLHESLPPVLQSSEVGFTVHGDGEKMKNGNVGHVKHITPDSAVKLIRRNVLRIVSESEDSETVKIYHCAENPLVYKDEDQKWCEIPLESAPVVEALIRNYPNYTRVADFPIDEEEDKVLLAMALWERGILITEEPLTDVSFTED